LCDRAASSADSRTAIATDDESTGDTHVVYEYPGWASVYTLFIFYTGCANKKQFPRKNAV